MLEYIEIPGTNLVSSRVALGTWAIGGWMWGGTDDEVSIRTIHAALDQGINLIDTAPIYGQGHSEEIVGEALRQHGRREGVILATKVGIDWTTGRIERNSSRQRILQEFEDSLRRLQTDYIDVYQVHWPDPLVPVEETAQTLHRLYREGRIRAIGVSNYSVQQMSVFALAVRWVLDQPGVSVALWGARTPQHLAPLDDVFGWSLDAEAHREIDAILRDTVQDPVGPEFMAPPAGRVVEEPQRLT